MAGGGGLGITWEDDPGSSDTGIVWEDDPAAKRDKKRLEALTGGATEEPASAPATPGYKESAFPVTAKPTSAPAAARPRPVPQPEPEGPSVLDAVLTPELQAARKRFAAARLSGSNAPNQPTDTSAQRLRAGGLDVFASPKPPDEPYDPRQEGVHRVGDVATGFGAAVSEALGGWGKLSPDATPIQRARLRRPEGLNLAGGGVRKYEPPAKNEPYLPLGAGVRQYRPTADRAAERLAALERGDDGTVRREAPQPLFAGKGLGEAPETTRLDLENPVGRTPAQFLRGTAPGRALENDYTKVHDWAQGAADDFGEWATKDTEHSSVARLIAAGENSDSALAQVLAAGTKGVIQAGASSAPALAEFAILHRATPGALKPLADAAMAAYFSGKEGVGQILEGAPALGTDIGSAFGGAPVPFEQMAQDFGKVGMGGFMAAGGAMASTPGTAAHDFITAGGRERADLARQLPGYADREMAARANSVEEMNPMIGALQRQPWTAPLTDFLFNRGESGKQPEGTSFLDRPKMRGGPWQNGLADLFPAAADAGEAQFNPDYVRMAESHGPPISPYTNPRRGEYSDQMPPPSARGTGIYARDVPLPPGEVPPRPGQPTPEQLKAMLDSILGPSVEGTRQGPFPVPPDISRGRTLPPGPPLPEGATWQERQEAARRQPAPPPPPPSMPPRYAPPEIPPDATWQGAQAAERGRRANPLEDPAKLKEILSNLLGPEPPQELEARTGRTPPAAEKIQPEPKATLDAQMQALVEGRKPAVLFPRQGEHAVPETPEGFVRVDTPAGAVIFDPNKVDAAAVAKAADSGKGLGKILGMGVDERPEGGTIVTARTPEGTEVQSAQATPEQVPAAVEAARKVAGPEGKVTEGTTEQIVAERQAGLESEKDDIALRVAKAVYGPDATPNAIQFVQRVLGGDVPPKAAPKVVEQIRAEAAKAAPSPGKVAPKGPWRLATDGMDVVPVVELKFSNGKWAQATGAPADAKWTGEKRTVGYAWKNRDGVTIGKRYATEAEARMALEGEKARLEAEARSAQAAAPLPEENLRTISRGDFRELTADPSFRPGDARAMAERPDEPIRYTHAEVQSEQLPPTRNQRAVRGGAPVRGPVRKHVVLWGADGEIADRWPIGIGPEATKRAIRIVRELNDRPEGGGILDRAEPAGEPDRTNSDFVPERRTADVGPPEGQAPRRSLDFVDIGALKADHALKLAQEADAAEQRRATDAERKAAAERLVAEHARARADQGGSGGGAPAAHEAEGGAPEPAGLPAGFEPTEAAPTEPRVRAAAPEVVPTESFEDARAGRRAISFVRQAAEGDPARGERLLRAMADAPDQVESARAWARRQLELPREERFKDEAPATGPTSPVRVVRDGDKVGLDLAGEPPAPPPSGGGRRATIWVKPDQPIEVEHRIVEAGDVVPSHDAEGRIDPRYPTREGLQPRDRSRDESVRQITTMARNLNPALLGESLDATTGAPVVTAAPEGGLHPVESGNGRAAAIREAYRTGRAGAYRERLEADAERYGMTPEEVAKMREPMLVRSRVTELTPEEQRQFTRDANASAALRMGVAEQATSDAAALTPEILSDFLPSEDGDVLAASNRRFLRRFFDEVVPETDRGELIDADGNPNLRAVQRIKAAIMGKAYGQDRLLARALEAADDNTRTVSAGLLAAAPRVAKVRAAIEAGELHPVDFLAPIKEAVDHLYSAKDMKLSVPDYMAQRDMFAGEMSPEGSALLAFMDKNKRSAKKIGGMVDSIARAVEGAGHPGQTDLFGGEADAPRTAEIYSAAKRIYEARHEETTSAQAGLFDQAGSGGPDRGEGPGAGPGGGGASGGGGGGEPGGGEPGGKPRVFSYSSGKGVGRDPYAERTGRQKVPVPSFKRLPRTPPVRPPEGPLEVLKAETIAPAYARLKDGAKEQADDIHELFSATTVSDSAKRVADIKRKNYAQRDFRMARLETAIRPVRDYFDKLRPKDRTQATVDFIGNMEEGKKQATPELEEHAKLIRSILDASWREIEQYGYDGSASYIKDYFPHLWEKADSAAKEFAHEWYERRSAEGGKTFLHRRFYESLQDGLDAGLKLNADNPADLIKQHVAAVQHYLMWQKEKGQSIRERLWRFKPVDQPMPAGWDITHPEKGVVYGDPSVQVGEAVTKRFRLMEEIAKDLNIPNERLAGVGGEFGRAEIGGTAGDGRVVTRFGTPVGVLAHEIGHILDHRYKLWDALMSGKDSSPRIRQELRDLADLRYESNPNVSEGYKQYVRSPEEQIANMLDAYVSEPGLMRELAPVTLGEFRSFLLKHPELHKFFDMQPGLELEQRVTRIPVKGKVIIGHWIAPRPVVKLIDRSLTPGLQNKLAYRIFRGITNAMNQIQLGMSGFHAVFTGLDAVTSQTALALEEAAAGEFGNAAKHLATAPAAPFLMLKEGKRIRDMAKSIAQGASFESMPPEIQNIMKAGGGLFQDTRYSTGQIDALKRSWNRGNPIAAAHLPGAFLEKMAAPIMEHWVPAIKLGMFAREAEFVLRRLGPDATGAEISHHLGRVWDSVENRMGQLRYDNLMWNRTVKDLGQVIVRSLGWNLGDIREIGGGAFDLTRAGTRSVKNAEMEASKALARGIIKQAEKDLAAAQQSGKQADIEKAEAKLKKAQAAMPSNLNDPTFTRRMAYTMAMPLTVGTMGAMYYWAKHGTLPTNVKDVFAIPTGGRNKDGSEERVFLPTYAKDVYAWFKDPFQTALHKLSPGVAIGTEIARNQDYFGTQVREGNAAEQTRDSVEHAISQMVPISFRQFMQSRFPGSNISTGESFAGITKAPASLSRSDAEEAINAYLRRTSGGVKTKDEAAKSKARSEIKALIRGGHEEAADAAIERAIAEHQVAPGPEGRKGLYKAAAMTGQENTLRSMPVEEALGVMRKATPEERKRWAEAFRARMYGSSPSRRPAWWREKGEEQRQAILDEADKYLPAE